MKIKLANLLLLLSLSLVACQHIPYRIDVDQGNQLTEANVSQLQLGMDKKTVASLLGLPILQHTFVHDRWDYVEQYLNGQTQKRQESRLSLYFAGDRLAKIDKSQYRHIDVPVPEYKKN